MSGLQDTLPNIPGYELVRLLGQGGMASVYLAVQTSFGRPVALKVMSPLLLVQRDFAERFYSEARMVASLSHPNIVTVFDVGAHEQYHYLAMEYHTGGHLGEKIEQGELTPQRALEITRELALGLHHAHEHGIIHRDMKPDNIIFSKRDTPIITDFGIARNVYGDSQLTQIGSTVGTPKYMSPEQARGERVDGRADIYSLGVILYEMLTGRPPYSAQDTVSLAIKHCQEPIPMLDGHVVRYQPLLDRLLAKDPAYRLQTGQAVADAIEQILIAPITPVSRGHQPVQPVELNDVQEAVSTPRVAPPLVAAPTKAPTPYTVRDEENGGFFSKRLTRYITFGADDFDSFSNQFQRMSDELGQWLAKYGRKADTLQLAIDAHPWIHKRILDRLTANHPPGNGYGDFARQGTVKVHLFDEVDPVGKHLLLREKGRIPTKKLE